MSAVLPDSEQGLWQRWLAERGQAVRNQLFFFYSAWVRVRTGHFYRKYPHPLAEWGDYVNLASIGLLQAIDRFNPARGSSFKAYAEPYIKGNILKGLACYIQDKPSPLQDRLDSLRDAKEDSSADELERLANLAIGLAFGCFLELGIEGAGEEADPLNIYEAQRDVEDLSVLVGRLSENEQQVIRGHYFQHLSFVEIAEAMGVTKGRVSQIHGKAVRRLREVYRKG
ncbi:sigma-70 family RNA polymerase sigma factor [Pseudomonas sp. RIT-PI-S]|uniref:sigma-70 family RNA polymerase sigma factor n=1 Tax=Pseudomonas sp. RIT-PI-S TaxID=3035295 RepID=UPI0021DAA252|nr:sigma-70 family RNA polymerase sigma factor [Pseudomonas sp. RIT-PI-S]